MSKKIQDFGEKIGGAKKDLWKGRNLGLEDLKGLNEREIFKYATKNYVWRKPDYKIMIEKGMPSETAYLLKKVRDSYTATIKPTKDQDRNKNNIENYIKTTEIIRSEFEKVKNNNDLKNLFNNIFVQHGYYNGYWTEKGRALSSSNILTRKFLKQVQITEHDIFKARKTVQETNFPEKQKAWEKNIKIRKSNDEFIIIKSVSNYRYQILKDGFQSEQEAQKYIDTQLKEELKKKKVRITRPQLEKIERTGVDYRNNKDITTDEFMNTFGFRGGEFGNWTNAEDRQQSLNMAYDAFMDLANILKVNPKAISFDGELAIAFGARGSGKAKAHYEPSKVVINLTKLKGAGSLAHEWGHALDDYFSRLSGDKTIVDPYVSHGINKDTTKLSKSSLEAWENIINKITTRELTKDEKIKQIDAQINKHKKYYKSWLDPIIKQLSQEQKSRNKVRRVATDKELEKAKELVNSILEGSNRDEDLDKLEELYKDVKGIKIEKDTRENAIYFNRWLNNYEEQLKTVDELIKKGKTEFYQNAQKLDTISGKSYWGNKEELFARAFESYIEDKAKEHGNKSDYLVYGTNASYGEYKPYPLEEERKGLYNEFEKFTIDLQELHKDDIVIDNEITKEENSKLVTEDEIENKKYIDIDGMTKDELFNAIENTQLYQKYKPTEFQIDWGNSRRGQGKRSGGMVLGGMSDAPQGKKTYVRLLGNVPEYKEKSEQFSNLENYQQVNYLKAREFGLEHGDSFRYMYAKDNPDYEETFMKFLHDKNMELTKQNTLKDNSMSNEKSVYLTEDDYTVKETKHTKTGQKLWVVKLTNQYEDFKELLSRFRKIGASYSKFTHGFNFKEDPKEKLKALDLSDINIKKPKDEIKRKSLEDYAKEYEENLNRVIEEIKDLDAFKVNKSHGEYLVISPSTKEPGKIQVTNFINNEPFSDAQLSNKREAAKRIVEYGSYDITDKIKYKVKNIGNISYDKLKGLPGKEYVIRLKEIDLNKLRDLEVPYTLFERDNSCSLVIKNTDKSKVMQSLGLRDKEIGSIDYDEFKMLPGNNKYLTLSNIEFDKIKNSNLQFSAFYKEDNKINVVIKEKDFKEALQLVERSIEKQLGNTKYSQMKNSPGNVLYRIYSKDLLSSIEDAGIKFAAFDKGNGKINVVFKSKDLEKVHSAIKKVQVVEKSVAR